MVSHGILGFLDVLCFLNVRHSVFRELQLSDVRQHPQAPPTRFWTDIGQAVLCSIYEPASQPYKINPIRYFGSVAVWVFGEFCELQDDSKRPNPSA
jgi:hypothetical protein